LISRNRANVLSFRDSDHGDGTTPLLEWIDGLLRQHGVDDAAGEIWLQTMPRMFGYVFNPVSFWFCHRDGRCAPCSAMCAIPSASATCTCSTRAAPSRMAANCAPARFSTSRRFARWGQYRFRFLRNSEQGGERHLARVDYDDLDGPLLQTSLSGTAQPCATPSSRTPCCAIP
jgi:hypothetical protein